MADDNSVQCEKIIEAVPGLKDQEVTVGRHVLLQCTGTWNKLFDFKKAQIKMDQPEGKKDYTIRIVKTEARSVSSFDVDVVFYSAGEYKFPDFVLSDGSNEIHLGQQNIKVQTVIEKTQDPKPPEPFGPIFPLQLNWPSYYLFISIGLIALSIFCMGWFLQRRYKFIKLMLKLKDYDSSIPADRQFYKAIRHAEIKDYPVEDLERAIRFYVARKYQVPCFDLKDKALISFFKKNNPWYKKERIELKKILEDIKLISKLNGDDAAKAKTVFIQRLYRFVDHTEITVKQGAK
ncbi:MAG: hypothetical protein WA160_11090 [Pseudobdellovibrio sp.]